MYCEYYGFNEKPFNITPDPGFIFLSAHHREAFAHLLYGIDSHVGFIALTGEVGTGKTTVIRTLLGQLDRDKYRTALIFNPCLSSLGLMQHINREYHLQGDSGDTADLLQELNRFLLSENGAGRTVLLVVDEAQNLSPSVLEQIRLISNLETERDKLIQIVLVGQPELRDLLQRHELRQLGQRVAVSYHLKPMDFSDTADYILHRLQVAGRRDSSLFSKGALHHIYAVSGGVPRLVNLVTDRTLLLGYTTEKQPISRSMAVKASKDLGRPKQGRYRLLSAVSALTAVAAAAIWVSASGQLTNHFKPEPVKDAGANIPLSPPDITADATRELGPLTDTMTIIKAYHALAKEWGLSPDPEIMSGSGTIESLIGRGGIEYTRFNGNMGSLLRFNTPVILELVLPGVVGKRHVAITNRRGNSFLITPALGGRNMVSASEIERIWSGRAYIPWKNHLSIPPGLRVSSEGPDVNRLQELLLKAGTYAGPVSGTFDSATEAAVKKFQLKSGIGSDGKAGPQTLQVLYAAAGYPAPLLAKEKLQ